MSHVVESAASRRHRRHVRTAVTLVVVVALLAGAFYYAASYWNKAASSSSASGCPTDDFTAGATPKALTPQRVTLNVYNATTRVGLAAETAKAVKDRGFVIGSVANDPTKKKVDAAGELRFGPNGKPGADLAWKLVDGLVAVQDTRADASVDLVLGNGFKGLTPGPTATTSAAPANPC